MLRLMAAAVAGLWLFLAAGGLLWADPGQGGAPQAGFYLAFTPFATAPFTVETSSPGLSPARTETLRGGGIGAGPGYRYGDWRIEGELLYGRNDAEEIRFSGGGGTLSGYYEMWGATVNLFYDFPTGTRLRPYLGAGLGGVLFEAHDITLAGFPPTRGRNTLFAYKFMAGLSYALTDAWRLLVGYRFLGLGAQDYETGGTPLRGDPLRMQAVQLGVQYHF